MPRSGDGAPAAGTRPAPPSPDTVCAIRGQGRFEDTLSRMPAMRRLLLTALAMLSLCVVAACRDAPVEAPAESRS